MKLICSKSSLLTGVQTVSKAVPNKTTMSILECILVDATKGVITLTANDMELGIETTIEGENYDQLMDIAKECQHVAIRAGAKHVSAYIKVVYQPEGEVLTIDRKITKHAEA